MKILYKFFIPILVVIFASTAVFLFWQRQQRVKVLEKVINRLHADSRVAEVLVTQVSFDEQTRKHKTTIKFLEYDADGNALEPKYFTFLGNIIQFQALVIRFQDKLVNRGDLLKGKSAYLFWKIFMLDGENTKEYDLTSQGSIPQGYKVEGLKDGYERKLWEKFWQYALDPKQADRDGVKNAQIEAPGTVFLPGVLYTIRIEHDGGLRIDARPLSPILMGETIPK